MSNVLSAAPSPVRLWTMLDEMVIGDLLGPAGGPGEEVRQGLHEKKKPRNTRKKTDKGGDLLG
jgi:hypothetical protein